MNHMKYFLLEYFNSYHFLVSGHSIKNMHHLTLPKNSDYKKLKFRMFIGFMIFSTYPTIDMFNAFICMTWTNRAIHIR